MRHVRIGNILIATAAVLVVPAGATASLGATEGRDTAAGLRATLPQGKGLFVATLRGRTLIWSLAYARHGGAASARIALVDGGTIGLCARCAGTSRGRLALSAEAADAVRSGDGTLLVERLGATLRGRVAAGAVPTLEILSPKPGATISLPAEIGYRVDGFAVTAGVRLAVSAVGTDAPALELLLPDASGTVMLPDVKSAFLAGSRDLTFRLIAPSGLRLPNAEAGVVVRDVRVRGARAAA
jgi:hypothetical protein